jgi:D-3-phosphoglycerate dehydrogenase / 2-oxoglutarate reductase
MSNVACLSLNSATGPQMEMLPAAGFTVSLAPDGANLFDENDLIEVLKGSVASVAGSEPYSRKVLEANPQLRVIARSGVGFDAVDMQACDEHGIVVATTPGVNHHAVAEHTISLIMGVARGFPRLDQTVRDGTWVRRATPRVMGTTLGIVGLGRIGRAVATRARGLGMNVVAFDPYASEEFADQWQIDVVSFDDLLAQSDYVTMHSPSSPETLHMINAESLAKMKQGSVLINTARGMLVDEPALIDALQSGHLRAAGLDVFEVEPLPMDSPLLKMDNVLLSGHVAGLDNESHHGMFAMCADTIISLKNGGWPTERIRNLVGVTDWKW